MNERLFDKPLSLVCTMYVYVVNGIFVTVDAA